MKKTILIFFAVFLTLFSYQLAAQTMKKKDISHLTDLQKHVTQENGTERPFANEYWDNKKEGIYVDVVSGEALFSSQDKYDAGNGWPSFSKPIEGTDVVKKADHSQGMQRVEVRSKTADSHLGHIFDDGPKEHGGQHYCINSASMKFIPKEDLEKSGYGKYMKLFNKPASKEAKYEKAILAGGCFWGMEELFNNFPGVINVTAGYTGGGAKNPVYELVKTGTSGHAESIEVTFDPKKTSYEKILKFFFKIHDPTTLNRQGNDRGTQYRSAIFYLNDDQKKIAEKVTKEADRSGVFADKVVTQINKADTFYSAEEYHQNYLQKHPNGYTCHYIREDKNF